jgi:hypothetical protein
VKQSWIRRFKESPAHTQTNIVCTAIVAVATVAYAIVAGFQLGAMRGQMKVMRETQDDAHQNGILATNQMWQAVGNVNWLARSMDWSQKVTRQSVEANERQSQSAIRTTQEQMRLEQRAWLNVGGPTGTPKLGIPWKIGLPVSNSGRTPARDVVFYPTNSFINRESIDAFLNPRAIPEFHGCPTPWPAVMPGNASSVFTFTAIPLSQAQREAMVLVIYGAATYKDVFKRPHWLSFCYIEGRDGDYSFCPKRNDTGDGALPNDVLKINPPDMPSSTTTCPSR